MQMPPPVHGVTTINTQVAASELLRARFDVDVLPLQFAESIDQLRRVSVNKLWRATAVAARLVETLIRRRPDVVYFTPTPSGPGFYRDCMYIALLKLFAAPRVYHLHAQGFAEYTGWRRQLCRWAFRDARAIVLSPSLRRDIAAFVPDEHVIVVPNGIRDTNATRPSRSGVPRILFLSNLLHSKGPYVLLEALAELTRAGTAFQATFAGAADGAADVFHTKIRELGLADRVEYVGPVYGSRKDEVLAACDVFVLPTWHDAFPLVLIEAMAWELPIVSTYEGAIPEMVADGETGYLVEPRDPCALAARLRALLEDAPLRAEMGRRGRQRFEARYTFAGFERRLVEALELPRTVKKRTRRNWFSAAQVE
jgi:glycosyltransferase involved in cell wall biosynthesis